MLLIIFLLLNHAIANIIERKLRKICYFRGFVHGMKLSPNLRTQSLDMRKAVMSGDTKKVWTLEVKKLDIILAMVNDPEEVVEQKEEDIL